MNGCGLLEIHQSDIQALIKLEELHLARNRISVLEQNLFTFNPKITEIDLSDNKIIHVESSVFMSLKILKKLNFKDNPCYSSEKAYDNRFEVLNLALSIQLNCFDKEIYKKEV